MRPSTRSPSGTPTAARPSGVRSTAGRAPVAGEPARVGAEQDDVGRQRRRPRSPPRRRPGPRRPAARVATISVGARSSLAAASGPAASFSAASASGPSTRKRQGLVRLWFGAQRASSNSSSSVAPTGSARRPCACGARGSARRSTQPQARWLISRPPCPDVRGPWMQGGARRRGKWQRHRPFGGAALRRGRVQTGAGVVGSPSAEELCESFRLRDFRPIWSALRPDCQEDRPVLRIDETSKTLVAPPAGGLVTEVSPDRDELLALVCSSWEAFAGELGQPSLRFVVQGQAPGLEVLAFDEQAGRAVVVGVSSEVADAQLSAALSGAASVAAKDAAAARGRPRVADRRRARRLAPDRAARLGVRRQDARHRRLAQPPPRARDLVLRAVGLPLRQRAAALDPPRVPGARHLPHGPRRRGPAPADRRGHQRPRRVQRPLHPAAPPSEHNARRPRGGAR